LTPTYYCSEWSTFGDRIVPDLDWRKAEDVLLNVWGQVEQVHDLRHAGLGDMGEAGQLGLIGDFAVAQELIEADGQGHPLRHAGRLRSGSRA